MGRCQGRGIAKTEGRNDLVDYPLALLCGGRHRSLCEECREVIDTIGEACIFNIRTKREFLF
jgi:hypothetical protein